MKISIKERNNSDLELIMAWRNIPDTYRYFPAQKGYLSWHDHYNYHYNGDQTRAIYMICLDDYSINRRVGVLTILNLNTKMPEIGLLIGEPLLWGQGVGKCVIQLAKTHLKNLGYKKACARIMQDNARSIKLFKSTGFTIEKADYELFTFECKL